MDSDIRVNDIGGDTVSYRTMKASITTLIILAIMLAIIIVAIRIYRKNMSEKTAMEKDAINKGLLAYFLTDSPLLGWLVYRKNDPKNRYK